MKYFKNAVGIIVVITLALIIINFRKIDSFSSLSRIFDGLSGEVQRRVGVLKNNVSFSTSPQRKRPLSLISREAKLSNLVQNVFGQFEPAQWDDFWSLVYEPIEEEQGGLAVKRYRSQKEIEGYLRYKYPNPFSYFKKETWDYFWSIVFGG